MINKIQITKFSNLSELKKLTTRTKQLISYLIFFENTSGNFKINHKNTQVKKFSVVNCPILSTLIYDKIDNNSNGWCVAFDKEARDVLLIHSFQLFCPFTGIVNTNIEKNIFNKLKFYLKEIQNEIISKNLSSSEIIYLQTAIIVKYLSRNIRKFLHIIKSYKQK